MIDTLLRDKGRSKENKSPRSSSAVPHFPPRKPVTISQLLSAPQGKISSVLGSTKGILRGDIIISRFNNGRGRINTQQSRGDSTQPRSEISRSRGSSQIQKQESLVAKHGIKKGTTNCAATGATNSVETKTVDCLVSSFNYKSSKPLRECVEINSFHNIVNNNEEDSNLASSHSKKQAALGILPLIIQKASIKNTPHKQKVERLPQKDSINLPRTGQYLPYGMYPALIPVPRDTNEEVGQPTSQSSIHLLQTKQAERLATSEYQESYKLVYDLYETSPYQEKYGYNEFLKYGMEESLIESAPSAYSLVCSGKGAPNKFVSNKSRYVSSLTPYYQLQSESDTTLMFESRFESANLRRAVQVYFY